MLLDVIMLPILLTTALLFSKSKKTIGLGPYVSIKDIGFKKALQLKGYSVEIAIRHLDRITEKHSDEIDVVFGHSIFDIVFRDYLLFLRSLTKYSHLITSFSGSSLSTHLIAKNYDHFLFKLNKLKLIIIPRGSDVEIFYFSRNHIYRNTAFREYTNKRVVSNRKKKIRQVEKICNYDYSYVFARGEMVDYIPYWDDLIFGPTTLDFILNTKKVNKFSRNIKIFHATNKVNTKGTNFITKTINELIDNGFNIEFKKLFRVSHEEILEGIDWADIVIDQLVIGWYGNFAIEALYRGKPVFTYLRPDIVDLYISNIDGFIIEEFPFINCNFSNFRQNLENYINEFDKVKATESKSINYYNKFHSIEFLGQKLDIAIKSFD